MKIPNIWVDEHGHSYFGEQELPLAGPTRRVQAKNQGVEYWQMGAMSPGHVIDFRPAAAAQYVAMMSGRLAITVSNGETRYFSRGDMFLLQDVKGQGHATRILGHEPATFLSITLPGKGEFK